MRKLYSGFMLVFLVVISCVGLSFGESRTEAYSEKDVIWTSFKSKYGFDTDFGGFYKGRAIAKSGNREGIVDLKGRFIVKPIYDEISNEYEHLTKVKLNDHYGMIDSTGKCILKPIYDDLDGPDDGMIKVTQKGKISYFDSTGKWMFDYKYKAWGRFENGLMQVMKNEKCGVINKHGKLVVPIKYDYLGEFKSGVAVAGYKNKYGLISSKGKVLVPFQYEGIEEWPRLFDNKSVQGMWLVWNSNKEGVLDGQGKVILPCEYDYIDKVLGQKLFVAQKKGKWGAIDPSGKVLVPFTQKSGHDIYRLLNLDDRMKVPEKIREGSGYYDPLADKCFKEYDDIDDFLEYDYVRVSKNEKFGLMDRTGKIIVPVQYEMLTPCDNGISTAMQNSKYGVIDLTGKTIIPFEYDYLGILSDGLIRATEDKKRGFIDLTGNVQIPFDYQYTYTFQKGKAWVSKDDKWGCIDKQGQIILPIEYGCEILDSLLPYFSTIEQMGKYSIGDLCGKVVVEKNGQFGIVENGKLIVDTAFSEIGRCTDEALWVRKGDKIGIIVLKK